ncbi:hypothetical protein Hanom_Chr02g00129631 [Helianthus anomalus]
MKNQDVNHLDENFQLKDPTKRPDRLVMELVSSHYDDVGNKSEVACWRYVRCDATTDLINLGGDCWALKGLWISSLVD